MDRKILKVVSKIGQVTTVVEVESGITHTIYCNTELPVQLNYFFVGGIINYTGYSKILVYKDKQAHKILEQYTKKQAFIQQYGDFHELKNMSLDAFLVEVSENKDREEYQELYNELVSKLSKLHKLYLKINNIPIDWKDSLLRISESYNIVYISGCLFCITYEYTPKNNLTDKIILKQLKEITPNIEFKIAK